VKKLLLIDGNSLLNRAYYAFGGGGALSSDTIPTNATFGFLNMFMRAVSDIHPDKVAVAFDVRAKTFRHKMYIDYKATRKGMPDDLAVQLEDLKKLLTIMNIAILESPGYEADDIIGTVSASNQYQTIILSADRDGLQLISENTQLHLTKTGVTNLDIWTPKRLMQEHGLTPVQLIDVKALMGDSSDNIPGATGVGEKTAYDLIRRFGTLENLYENLIEVSAGVHQKLVTSYDTVMLSRELARINLSVPLVDSADFSFVYPFGKEAYDAFWARGFKSLCKRPNIWAEAYYSDDTATAVTEKPAQPKPIEFKSTRVTTQSELDALVQQLLTMPSFAIHYDSNAFYLSPSASEEYVLPLKLDLLGDGFYTDELIPMLKPLFECSVPKLVFDSTTFKRFLTTRNIALNNVTIDAKLCDHLLTTATNVDCLDQLFTKYKTSSGGRVAPIFTIDFTRKLGSSGALNIYQQIELPLVDILLEMGKTGAKIDLVALDSISDKLQRNISELTAQIYDFAGEHFNINSPKQLGEILYKKLGLSTSTRKSGKDESTDEASLQKIAKAHPIVPVLMRYRKVFKLYSTYVQGYRNALSPENFVHPKFNNTATTTGRLSCSEPNIQNIPTKGDEEFGFRKIFISRFPNGKLLTADYSQIELRLLAHYSDDPTMIEAYKNNRDIHTETAAKVFGCHPELVNSDMRRRAKAINFGIVYGMSAFGLSNEIGCTVPEATAFIERYFAEFAGVARYLDKCKNEAITSGYVETLMGRRRNLPELNSGNQNSIQFALRAATNMPMQGGASDIIKSAMVAINAKFKEGLTSVMFNQVHDELVFDCTKEEVERVEALVREIMECVTELKVPLVANIEIADTL
jgi:DNA polymerase-1